VKKALGRKEGRKKEERGGETNKQKRKRIQNYEGGRYF